MGGSVRSAAESAEQDGWEVSAIDLFGDVDTRRSARRWHRLTPTRDFSLLLGRLPPGPLILTGGMEQWYERLDGIRHERPVLAPATETIARLREPAFLQSLAHASGLHFPRFRPAGSAEVPRGWLAKSRRSTAGLSVSTSLAGPPSDADYFQQRVAGRPFGAAFLATDSGSELLGVARSMTRSMGRYPFLYAGSLGPVRIAAECRRTLERLGETIRQQLSMRGLFGVDLLADRSGERLWLLEINPRITASMELFETPHGPSLITRHAASYGFVIAARRAATTQTAAFAAELPVRLKRIVWSREAFRWNPEWQQAAVSGIAPVVLRDIPQPDSAIACGQPVVSLCASGWSIRECLRAAKEVERRLHEQIGERRLDLRSVHDS